MRHLMDGIYQQMGSMQRQLQQLQQQIQVNVVSATIPAQIHTESDQDGSEDMEEQDTFSLEEINSFNGTSIVSSNTTIDAGDFMCEGGISDISSKTSLLQILAKI